MHPLPARRGYAGSKRRFAHRLTLYAPRRCRLRQHHPPCCTCARRYGRQTVTSALAALTTDFLPLSWLHNRVPSCEKKDQDVHPRRSARPGPARSGRLGKLAAQPSNLGLARSRCRTREINLARPTTPSVGRGRGVSGGSSSGE